MLNIEKLSFFFFAQIVFKLLYGPKFDWMWTVRLPSEILTEACHYIPTIQQRLYTIFNKNILTSHITNFGHLVANAK